MSISFNAIPGDTRDPFTYVELDNSGAIKGPAVQTYRGLLIGQKTSSGTAAALTPVRVTSVADAATRFGAGSMLHNMAEAWFAQQLPTELWAVPIVDGESDVAAAGSIVFSGTPTEAGTIAVYIAGRKVTISCATTSTATTLGTALRDAINNLTSLPVTATASTGTVTVTAKNKGLAGNGIDIRSNYYAEDATPAGVTVTITGMASGTGVPDLATVFAAIPNESFNVIANPYKDAATLTALETELSLRWGPLKMEDGTAFTGVSGNISTVTALTSTRNSPFNCFIPANGSPTPLWEWAAETAIIVANRAQADPARPHRSLRYVWCKPGASPTRFNHAEREILLHNGCSTYTVDAGGYAVVGRLITSYRKNAAGGDDVSYLDVNTLLTLSYLRYDWRNLLQTKYADWKLADDGTRFGPGNKIVTPNVIKAECLARARDWESMGLVENFEAFKEGLIVERNAQNRTRLDIRMTPDLVNQLYVTATQIGFIL